jgi:predicted transcriptional regulator
MTTVKIVRVPKSIKLFPDQWDTLHRIARQNGRTRNAMLVEAAEKIIAENQTAAPSRSIPVQSA